jgi:hypothetical protein
VCRSSGVREPRPADAVTYQRQLEDFMRSILLWAIGIPLPIIIILWLVTGHA